MKTLIIIFVCVSTLTYSQNYENVFYQINVTKKVVKTAIINGDTLIILEKKVGSKYVDSLELNTLDQHEYNFALPDSLPNGKYSVFYDDKKQNIAFIINYVNGKRNGSFRHFYYNGNIREYGFYLNNCFDKVRIENTKTGQLSGISNFDNCNLEGMCYKFSSTGEFYMMTTYHNGKKNGKVITYKYDKKKNPSVQYNFEYKDDEIIKKNYR